LSPHLLNVFAFEPKHEKSTINGEKSYFPVMKTLRETE